MTHTIEDLVAAAVGQRPMDFEQSFNSLIAGKASAAIENHKLGLAQTMFNDKPEEEEKEVEEDPNTEE